MLSTRHIAGLSNERVNGACNFPKPLKSRAIDEERKKKLATRTLRRRQEREWRGVGRGRGRGQA